MTMDNFLEERVTEDPDLPADDKHAKLEVIALFRALGSSNTMHADAWSSLRQVLRILGSRYTSHPDYKPVWEFEDVPQRVALGIDQQAVTL